MTLTPDLCRRRMDALYRRDRRGRMLSINQWDGGIAPRFHLFRTVRPAVRRFRADLPGDLVDRLGAVSRREPIGEPLARLPAFANRYLELLAAHGTVSRVWAGPVFVCPRAAPSSRPAVDIGASNADLLTGGFEAWLDDVPHRRPFMAIIEDGRAVSICASVRISDQVHCAGVETLGAYRRRGLAADAVAGWARSVRALAAEPFYSTSWDNVASQGVAASMGMTLVGVDFHVT